MNKPALLALALCILTVASMAQAAIYKSVDAEGRITYSNMPSKGAAKLEIDPVPDASDKKPERANRVKTPTPANFPRVDSQTQNQRDDKRKQILASELETEQKALVEARRAFSESAPNGIPGTTGKPDDKLEKLHADVQTHENNVQLLQKELRSIK